MSNKNEVLKFAKKFNMTKGIFTFSGEMALEVALYSIKVRDKCVILPNNVCHSVLLSVLRSNAIPILVAPKNGFTLSKSDIIKLIDKYSEIAAIIIVHQYGIQVDLSEIKKVAKDIPIIEDVAQGWSLNNIGTFSNYVITSFGVTKQLSYGIGGGIFSNNEEIEKVIDKNFRYTRYANEIVLPYYLPENIKINYKKLETTGNRNVKKQLENSEILIEIFKEYKDIQHFETAKGVWNRFPIWLSNEKEYKKIIRDLKKFKVQFELQHEFNLDVMPMLKNVKYYFENYNSMKEKIIYIKVRNCNKKDLLKWKKSVKKS
ncbi:MAG: DegT/DnrJ/EryC1/StrS family aminotransferase [Oscillospiraceae bacterium]|nr:DegT/DnrJ/EryC1/StrS family aminotransferase [Oscillospiraceae bacterium]